MNEGESSSSIPSSQFLSFCPICDKAFTREYSYSRHVSYCRRSRTKPKIRARSCQACSSAKLKCSFEQPKCTRCTTKGLTCVYERLKRVLEPTHLPEPTKQTKEPQMPQMPLSSSNFVGLSQNESLGLRGFNDTNITNISPYDINPSASMNVDTMSFLLDDANDTGLDYRILLYNNEIDFADLIQNDQSTYSTASSEYQGSSGSPYNELAFESNTPATLPIFKRLQPGNPTAQQAANLVMNVIRSFPQMMLRRQTFPPFIHPLWHLPYLPERLATCMSIAQLFASRTPETRPFIWRSIKAEEDRMSGEVETCSKYDIQYAVQALQIYMIMAIVDRDAETAERGAHMIRTCQVMTRRFRALLNGSPVSEPERTHPSPTWEEWIFAENRRRIACVWFLISRIISVKTGLPCSGFEQHHEIPVCSAKTMWDARSREEWETEREFHELGTLHRDMWCFGALIDAHRHPEDPLSTERLDAWNAGTDKIGTLMSIAVDLV